MKIFTSNGSDAKVEHIKRLDMGCLICSLPTSPIVKGMKKVECALDNGAFSAWQRGFPFMGDVFLKTLSKAYNGGIKLKFIVCPDIVAGGKRSLDYSMKWAESDALESANNLYLAVQDGIKPKDVDEVKSRFSGIFVGGTLDWKYKTGMEWVEYAHSNDMECHIGRVGTIDKLKWAYNIGADTVDSSSFVRNDSWDIIEEFYKWVNGEQTQTDMFCASHEIDAREIKERI